jgi:hypothetical protein
MDITLPLYLCVWAFALAALSISVVLAFTVGFWIYLECKGAVGSDSPKQTGTSSSG